MLQKHSLTHAPWEGEWTSLNPCELIATRTGMRQYKPMIQAASLPLQQPLHSAIYTASLPNDLFDFDLIWLQHLQR